MATFLVLFSVLFLVGCVSHGPGGTPSTGTVLQDHRRCPDSGRAVVNEHTQWSQCRSKRQIVRVGRQVAGKLSRIKQIDVRGIVQVDTEVQRQITAGLQICSTGQDAVTTQVELESQRVTEACVQMNVNSWSVCSDNLIKSLSLGRPNASFSLLSRNCSVPEGFC